MGLNLSNQQIAQALELNKADVHEMTTFLRQAIHNQRQTSLLQDEVEFDEVYIVAGHKGQPAAVSVTPALASDRVWLAFDAAPEDRIRVGEGESTRWLKPPPLVDDDIEMALPLSGLLLSRNRTVFPPEKALIVLFFLFRSH
jgi:hypothetical protein